MRLQRAGVGGAVSYALSALHVLPPPAAGPGQSRPGGRPGSPQPHLGSGILPPQASKLSLLFCQLRGGPEKFCVLPGVTQLQEGSPGSAADPWSSLHHYPPPRPVPRKRHPAQSENSVGSMNSAHPLQIAPPSLSGRQGPPEAHGGHREQLSTYWNRSSWVEAALRGLEPGHSPASGLSFAISKVGW